MKYRIPLVAAVIFLLSGSAVIGAEEIPIWPVKIDQLNDHLYVLTVTGGEEFGLPPFETNLIASVGPDGILLIDAGFNSTGQTLADTINALWKQYPGIIINTHFHADHASGNRHFREKSIIMSHKNAMGRLNGDFFHLPGIPSEDCPVIGIDDSLLIRLNGETIHVIHAPDCHTNGDLFIHFVSSKIVAAGDLFFPDEIPYIDLFSRGSVDGYIARIDNFINSFPDDTKFIAAHGRYYGKNDLIKYKQMLDETILLVKEKIADGKEFNTAVSENILDDWSEWEGRFPTTTLQAWIQTIYSDNTFAGNAKISICEPLTKILKNEFAEKAVSEYYKIKTGASDGYDFSENQLNALGYQLMLLNRIDDAIKIFELNIESYPSASNVYDSYAEGLLVKGDTAASIYNYKKSLEINPENTNAAAILKKLSKAE